MSERRSVMDSVILTDRDEVSDHLGRELTDEEWQEAKAILNKNKHLWQVVDEAISELESRLVL
jgi:hypothetical protein